VRVAMGERGGGGMRMLLWIDGGLVRGCCARGLGSVSSS